MSRFYLYNYFVPNMTKFGLFWTFDIVKREDLIFLSIYFALEEFSTLYAFAPIATTRILVVFCILAIFRGYFLYLPDYIVVVCSSRCNAAVLWFYI